MADVRMSSPAVRKSVAKALKQIMRHHYAGTYFNEPVDAVALGIPEYFDEIKNPMDLGTVLTKMNKEKYATAHDVLDDIQLVWNNCFQFNEEDSDATAAGKEVKRFAECIWKDADLPMFRAGPENQETKEPKQRGRPPKDMTKQKEQASDTDLPMSRAGPELQEPKAPKLRGKPHKDKTKQREHASEGAKPASLLKKLSKKGVVPHSKELPHPPDQAGRPPKKKQAHPMVVPPVLAPKPSLKQPPMGQASKPPGSLLPSEGPKIKKPTDGQKGGINRLGGLAFPPIPGGLKKLCRLKKARSGGVDATESVHVGLSGGWRVLKRSRSMTRASAKPAAVREVPPMHSSDPVAPKREKKQKDKAATKPTPVAKAQPPGKVQGAKPGLPAHPLARCLLVVDKLLKNEDAEPFAEPVDPEEAPEYSSIISKPMDLGTIAGALRPGVTGGWGTVSYKSVADVMRDIDQVWENCRLYNDDAAPVRVMCINMEKAFEVLCQKYSLSRPPKQDSKQSNPSVKASKAPAKAPKKRKVPTAPEPSPVPPKKKRKPRESSPTPITTAPRPAARVPNNKSRRAAAAGNNPAMLGGMDLGGAGSLLGLDDADELFTAFGTGDRTGQPSTSGPKCDVCTRSRRGRCGTESSVIKCERRAANGLPTYEDVTSGVVKLGKGGSIIQDMRPPREGRKAVDNVEEPQPNETPEEAYRRREKDMKRRHAQRQAEMQRQQQQEEQEEQQQREQELLARREREKQMRAARAEAEARMRQELKEKEARLREEQRKEEQEAQRDPFRDRLVEAAIQQQQAASRKLTLMRERAEEGKRDFMTAMRAFHQAQRLLEDVNVGLQQQQEAMLSDISSAVPDGCQLVDRAAYQPRNFPGVMPPAMRPRHHMHASLLEMGSNLLSGGFGYQSMMHGPRP